MPGKPRIRRVASRPSMPGITLENVTRISWRLTDALGYAALDPPKPGAWAELVGLLPLDGSSWLVEEQTAAAEVSKRLASGPL